MTEDDAVYHAAYTRLACTWLLDLLPDEALTETLESLQNALESYAAATKYLTPPVPKNLYEGFAFAPGKVVMRPDFYVPTEE